MRVRSLENRAFLLLVALVTLAFLWTLQGFLLPVFWAVVLAVLFTPLYKWLESRLRGHSSIASLLTLLTIFLLIVVPIVLIGAAVTNEAVNLYSRVASGELDINAQVQQVEAMLPRLTGRAAELGVDLDRVREGLESAALGVSRSLAARLLAFGQQALTFTLLLVVTFYTLFFFLKDGDGLVAKLIRAMPLGDPREKKILDRFASVTRATIKGTFIVAIVQGAIGGVTFAFLGLGSPLLWGVTMALMSLLPAVGAAAVWLPAALFLIISGDVWSGLILIGVGAGIIGLVDNALRPILVGRDAGMPDYVILLSTLGGIAAFGISGIVIGPVVAGLFLTVWEIFTEEFGARDSQAPQVEMAKPDATTQPGVVPAEDVAVAASAGAVASTPAAPAPSEPGKTTPPDDGSNIPG